MTTGRLGSSRKDLFVGVRSRNGGVNLKRLTVPREGEIKKSNFN